MAKSTKPPKPEKPAEPTKEQGPLKISPKLIANSLLQQVIESAGERSLKTKLAALMSGITGAPVTRQMVERWLHPNPEKRDHPSLGNGILLLAAFRAHQQGITDSAQLKEIIIDIKSEIKTRK